MEQSRKEKYVMKKNILICLISGIAALGLLIASISITKNLKSDNYVHAADLQYKTDNESASATAVIKTPFFTHTAMDVVPVGPNIEYSFLPVFDCTGSGPKLVLIGYDINNTEITDKLNVTMFTVEKECSIDTSDIKSRPGYLLTGELINLDCVYSDRQKLEQMVSDYVDRQQDLPGVKELIGENPSKDFGVLYLDLRNMDPITKKPNLALPIVLAVLSLINMVVFLVALVRGIRE